jgi:hypothetical protein
LRLVPLLVLAACVPVCPDGLENIEGTCDSAEIGEQVPAELVFDPPSLDFGIVPFDQDSYGSIRLVNIGGAPLEVISSTVCPRAHSRCDAIASTAMVNDGLPVEDQR